MYIISTLVNNENVQECFHTKAEVIKRVGSVKPGDKIVQVYSLSYEGELKKHSVVFTDRLVLEDVTEVVEEGVEEDGGVLEESQPIQTGDGR